MHQVMQSLIDAVDVQGLLECGGGVVGIAIGSVGESQTQKIFRQSVIHGTVLAFDFRDTPHKRRNINIW